LRGVRLRRTTKQSPLFDVNDHSYPSPLPLGERIHPVECTISISRGKGEGETKPIIVRVTQHFQESAGESRNHLTLIIKIRGAIQ
jgi:hypothetical protein